MRRAGFMATVALAAASVTTIAAQESRTPGSSSTADQNRTNQQTPTTQTPANQSATGATTVTGCIQSSGEGAARTYTLMTNMAAAGSGSSTGARSDSAAKPDAGAGAAQSRPGQSTAAGSGAASNMTTYTLEGGDVATHVGHQVEITGILASSAGTRAADRSAGAGATTDRPNSAAGAASGNDRSAVGTSGNAGDRQTLRVTAVKMLSATCSR